MKVEINRVLRVVLCGISIYAAGGGSAMAAPAKNYTVDLTCDQASYPSWTWFRCESENFDRIWEAPKEQFYSFKFAPRTLAQGVTNVIDYADRAATDPSWLLASPVGLAAWLNGDYAGESDDFLDSLFYEALDDDAVGLVSVSLNSPLTPLCATWGLPPCVGDPFRYPGVDGQDGETFYVDQAQVTPVVFYDRGCARLSGRVWRPTNTPVGERLPAVVIESGSVQAPETAYWWAAQALVRQGYVVLTFDPRGQGRSDWQTPAGGQGGNLDISVFWTGLIDAIDFFRSSPQVPYPHNSACSANYPTLVTDWNPYHTQIDSERLGLAGHSAGAAGVSVVQGYDSPEAGPWPGVIDNENPVDVVVAWDSLTPPGGIQADGWLESLYPGANVPDFAARVPAMSFTSDYGVLPVAFTQPPSPTDHKQAFTAWQAAGVPSYTLTIRGSTHYEWSLLPGFPATSWCPTIENGACAPGWGNAMARHYTLAWFDRWLKVAGEPGYANADARLLDDNGIHGRRKMSFRFESARAFTTRAGAPAVCIDIRAGCID